MNSATLPRSDTKLLTWTSNLLSFLTPAPATYNVPSTLLTSLTAANTSFAASVTACEPSIRSKSSVVAKNTARANLKKQIELVAGCVDASTTLTDAQKTQIGLPPRSAPTPTPIPSSAPGIEVKGSTGWTVHLKLNDTSSDARRGKPAGVSGASVWSYIGANPPSDITQWVFQGNTGKSFVNVTFNNTVAPGTKVWFTAFWFNGRKQSGPTSTPTSALIAGGNVSLAA